MITNLLAAATLITNDTLTPDYNEIVFTISNSAAKHITVTFPKSQQRQMVEVHERLVTNEQFIGTFTDLAWRTFDVQQYQRATNTVFTIHYDGEEKEFVFKSIPGDIIGEKKVEKRSLWFTNFYGLTNTFITNAIVK